MSLHEIPPTSPPKKLPFTIGWLNWSLVLLWWIVSEILVFAGMSDRIASKGTPYFIGIVVGGTLMTLLLAAVIKFISWLVFLVSGRDRRVGRWVFAGLVGFFMLMPIVNGASKMLQRRNAKLAVSNVSQNIDDLKASTREEFMENGSVEFDPDAVRKVQEEMNDTLQYATGADRQVATVLFAFNNRYFDAAIAYSEATTVFEELAERIGEEYKNESDLDQLIESIKSIEKESEQILGMLRTCESSIRGELDAVRISKLQRDELIASFLSEGEIPQSLLIYELDWQSYQILNEMLHLLKEEWGKWAYDDSDDSIVFDDDESGAKLVDLCMRLDEVSEELYDTQRSQYIDESPGDGG